MRLKQLHRLLLATAGAVFLDATSAQGQQLIWTYDTDLTTTTNPIAMDWGNGWGVGSTFTWSPMDANGNPNSGSEMVTVPFSAGNTYTVLQCWPGPTVDLSDYNDFSIDVYFPPGVTNLGTDGTYGNMDFRFRTGGNWPGVDLLLNGGQNITNSGWNHFDVPFPTVGIAPTPGWNLQWNTSCTNTVSINIDNVRFYYNTNLLPPPPPTVSFKPAVPGLNIIACSDGNSFYDRQEVRLTNIVGVAWVGHATPANPVKYSYTIRSFNSQSYGNPGNQFAGQYAYLFLVPNAAIANSPDYNNAVGCQIFVIQESPTNAVLQFQYKVALPNGNDMYYGRGLYTNAPGSWDGVTTPWYESGNLGGVTNYAASSPAVGTWTIEFTSDTNLTLIAPSGDTASYVIPTYNIASFSADNDFGIYLGNMAQTQGGLNQDIIYSAFSVTGVPNPWSDNFLADSSLLPQWDPTESAALLAVTLLPSTARYAATWGVAKGAWSVSTGTNLLQMTNWAVANTYAAIPEVNQTLQFVDQADLPPGPIAFLNARKLVFSQLLVLLPGETIAPGTTTGKTGTPTVVSMGAGGFEDVTVMAVDSAFHPIPGVSDTIQLTTTDASAIAPDAAALEDGTITFGVTGNTQPMSFATQGTWTITATDMTATNISPATSSSVTVGP